MAGAEGGDREEEGAGGNGEVELVPIEVMEDVELPVLGGVVEGGEVDRKGRGRKRRRTVGRGWDQQVVEGLVTIGSGGGREG